MNNMCSAIRWFALCVMPYGHMVLVRGMAMVVFVGTGMVTLDRRRRKRVNSDIR